MENASSVSTLIFILILCIGAALGYPIYKGVEAQWNENVR